MGYWDTRVSRARHALQNGEDVIGIFLCGRLVHQRRISGVTEFGSARKALGREPSEQGKKALGDGRVLKFVLGEAR